MTLQGDGTLLLVGGSNGSLGGSEYLAQFGFEAVEADRLPEALAWLDEVEEMVSSDAGASVVLEGDPDEALFCEAPGRAVVETTDPDAVTEFVDDDLAVTQLGDADGSGTLAIDVDGTALRYPAERIAVLREVIPAGME